MQFLLEFLIDTIGEILAHACHRLLGAKGCLILFLATAAIVGGLVIAQDHRAGLGG